MNIGELEIDSYMDSSGNYGTNSIYIKFKSIGTTLYFSYNTLIGVKSNKYSIFIVSENIWNNTTGKHINKLKDMYNLNELSRDKFIETVNKMSIELYME